MKIAICTTYNEETSIYELVWALKLQNVHVWVIDAGSRDRTRELAHEAGATVFERGHKEPIASCLVYGWNLALDWGNELRLLQIDAGGSHIAAQCHRLFDALEWGADMVIGSRFITGALYAGEVKRAAASRLAAGMLNLRYKQNISDWTSGYRAFSGRALRRLAMFDYRATMHGWQIEVLKNALSVNLQVAEVPITYRSGRSSMNGRIALEALRQWAY